MFDRLTEGAKYAFYVIGKHIKDFVGNVGKFLKPIGKLLNQWLIQPLLHPIKTIKSLASAFKTVFGAIGKVVMELGSNIWTLITSIVQCVKEFGFFHTMGEIIKDLLSAIGGLFKNLWGIVAAHPLAALVAAIALVVSSFVSMYNRCWQFRGALNELWQNVLMPVVNYVRKQGVLVWENVLQPLWNNIKDMVASLIELVTAVWNKVSECIAWVSIYIIPPVWMVAGEIIAAATRIFGNIGEIINGIITAIKGIITFLTGVFTGDWKKAWEGIVTAFGGIFSGLWGVMKGPLNVVIGGINAFIGLIEGAINSVARIINSKKITLPNWDILGNMAGKSYGLNISTVSLTRLNYLADGGVLDQPTAAMMGEYAGAHNNPEIVTPENLMRQIVMEGNDDLADTFIAVGRQIVAAIQDNNLEIKIGDDVISAAAARGDRDFKKRTGRSQFAI